MYVCMLNVCASVHHRVKELQDAHLQVEAVGDQVKALQAQLATAQSENKELRDVNNDLSQKVAGVDVSLAALLLFFVSAASAVSVQP